MTESLFFVSIFPWHFSRPLLECKTGMMELAGRTLPAAFLYTVLSASDVFAKVEA